MRFDVSFKVAGLDCAIAAVGTLLVPCFLPMDSFMRISLSSRIKHSFAGSTSDILYGLHSMNTFNVPSKMLYIFFTHVAFYLLFEMCNFMISFVAWVIESLWAFIAGKYLSARRFMDSPLMS